MAVLLLLVMAGCSTAPGGYSAGAEMAPADFSIDFTVLAGDEGQVRHGAEHRAARYVVLPDGTLHARVEAAESRADGVPRYVRTLHRAETDALWRLTRDLGLTDPVNVDAVGNLDLYESQAGQTAYLVAVVSEGRRLNFGRAFSGEDVLDDRLVRLARTLAGLAWVRDEPDVEATRRIPRRYDFGPDPYARYRMNTGGARP